MKKIFAALFAFLMLISILPTAAFAEYEDMTDEELITACNEIRLELSKRGFSAEGKKVLYDADNIQIYLNGDFTVKKTMSDTRLLIPIIIVNGAPNNILVQTRIPSVNGWGCDVSFSETVAAGKKMKSEIVFKLDETEIETIDDFEDAEFCFYICNNDDWSDNVTSSPIQFFAQ